MENSTNNGETENRQSRGNEVDIAWLAGIVDGEGMIALNVEGRRYMVVRPTFVIGNCDLSLMEKAQRIMYEITHVKKEVVVRPANRAGYGVRKRDFYTLTVADHAGVSKLCDALLPHLTCKAKAARLTRDFCRIRKERRHKTGRGPTGLPYGDEERAIIREFNTIARKHHRPYPAHFGL